jgi:uncharacterized membrane protein YbaN (DUF454 family)
MRWLLLLLGGFALVLGLIGLLLPGIPTTPFVLVAAACYARASPRLHRRMRENRWIGPMLRDWEDNRSLSRRVKTVAVAMMAVMVGMSIWTLQQWPWAQAALVLAGLLGIWYVGWHIPTRKAGTR